MSVQQMQQLDDEGMKAWDEHNADAWAEMFAGTFEWRDDTQPGPLTTKESAKQYMRAWITAFPDLKVKTINRVVGDDSVGAEIEFTGTNKGPLVMGDQSIPATNKKVVAHATYFSKARNGKIVEFHTHPNVMELMGQMGIGSM